LELNGWFELNFYAFLVMWLANHYNGRWLLPLFGQHIERNQCSTLHKLMCLVNLKLQVFRATILYPRNISTKQ